MIKHHQKLKDDAKKKLEWDELRKNVVIDDDMMTDMRTSEFLSPEVGYTCSKEIF